MRDPIAPLAHGSAGILLTTGALDRRRPCSDRPRRSDTIPTRGFRSPVADWPQPIARARLELSSSWLIARAFLSHSGNGSEADRQAFLTGS
jgi:hypothetical protein